MYTDRMKLLKQVYKTYEGALSRAAFENGVAPFEYRMGYKARLYHYTIVADDTQTPPVWRVRRDIKR